MAVPGGLLPTGDLACLLVSPLGRLLGADLAELEQEVEVEVLVSTVKALVASRLLVLAESGLLAGCADD